MIERLEASGLLEEADRALWTDPGYAVEIARDRAARVRRREAVQAGLRPAKRREWQVSSARLTGLASADSECLPGLYDEPAPGDGEIVRLRCGRQIVTRQVSERASRFKHCLRAEQ